MDNQKVRAHLRKGELAVQLLEGMGFKYTPDHHPAKWVAPASFVNMEEALKEMQSVVDKFAVKKEPVQLAGPVRDGASFIIVKSRIPQWNHLHIYGNEHFRGKTFKVIETQWVNNSNYRGWAVTFNFRVSFRGGFETVWLPMDCIEVLPNADF